MHGNANPTQREEVMRAEFRQEVKLLLLSLLASISFRILLGTAARTQHCNAQRRMISISSPFMRNWRLASLLFFNRMPLPSGVSRRVFMKVVGTAMLRV
jgi:hypothetical protein